MSTKQDTAYVLTVEEVAERLKVGRTTVYGLIKAGEIGSVKVAGLRRVPVQCITDYLTRQLASVA